MGSSTVNNVFVRRRIVNRMIERVVVAASGN
jgi:hypothetical protein